MASSDGLSNHLQKLNLNSPAKLKYPNILLDIKDNYESIFSWDIYEKTEKSRNTMMDILEKVTQKLDILFENNTFDFNRICLGLISCFEIFLNGEFSKALENIDGLIQTLNCTKMDTFFQPISDACYHVVYATQVYIKAFLKDDNVEQILQNIKPSCSFNKDEKAAIYAIKSKIFLEYPPEGNIIALELAESARNFNDSELYWITIWLKAKGRKRRFHNKFTLPSRDELEAANKLSSCENNPELLLCASQIFCETGFILKRSGTSENYRESNKYYKLSADLTLKAYKLAKNNLRLLYHCLLIYMDLPRVLIQSHYIVLTTIVSMLSQKQNINKINGTLGKYYLKIVKDNNKAKTYLEKASINGSFSSSLQLFKVECLLKSKEDFPVVQYLDSLYEKYKSPKFRLIITSQILLYYIYIEKNPKQLLHYLDVYLNEDIDYVQKKHHINAIFPLYNLKTRFNTKIFLEVLKFEVENLKIFPHWDSNDKQTLENIVSKFTATCNPERTEANTEITLTCVVCLELDAASVVLRPCNHQCICETCWNVLKQDQLMCPMCRQVVISTLIVSH